MLAVMSKPPNRIRERRETVGLTLEQLADAVNSTLQQISRLEKGQRRLTDDWLGKLSAALRCRKSDLIYDTPAASGAHPSESDFVKDDVERDLLTFWRTLRPEHQDVILDLIDLWAERRTRRTGTH